MANNQNNNSGERRDRVSFDIVDRMKVLRTKDSGWTKEINMVAWNGGAPKLDIRDWNPEHTRMAKGITLDESEVKMLLDALSAKYDLEISEVSASPA